LGIMVTKVEGLGIMVTKVEGNLKKNEYKK
jgi:hypothetical protein